MTTLSPAPRVRVTSAKVRVESRGVKRQFLRGAAAGALETGPGAGSAMESWASSSKSSSCAIWYS